MQMIEGLHSVVNITNDLLVWGDFVEEHDHRLKKLLERAREYKLKLKGTVLLLIAYFFNAWVCFGVSDVPSNK